MTTTTMLKLVLRGTLVFAVLSLIVVAGFPAPAETHGGRTVKYSQQDVVSVRAKTRFSTLIVLPQNEEILDFATGDKDFWIINGAHNLCYVHPAQVGIRSNLHLVTSSGHVYSFLLMEISKDPTASPDLKLFIEPKEESSVSGPTVLQGYVRADEAEAYKKELNAVRKQRDGEVRAVEVRANEQMNKFRAEYPRKLQFDYDFDSKAAGEPFLISAIYHDEAFTYIKCAAREKPTLYEVKDGKPNLINFQLEGDAYIVPKIIDTGYLTIGKKKLTFARRG